MPDERARPPITPDTKVGDLLAHYPELEETLVSLSPTYRALKNPVLRRTVARVATLRQVARVGDVALGTLITRLRQAAGQTEVALVEDAEGEGVRPAWADPQAVTRTHDARPTIEAGGQPMEQVMRDLSQLQPGQVYALLTPFVPAPLVELAERKGFVAYSEREGSELVRTYFTRAQS